MWQKYNTIIDLGFLGFGFFFLIAIFQQAVEFLIQPNLDGFKISYVQKARISVN